MQWWKPRPHNNNVDQWEIVKVAGSCMINWLFSFALHFSEGGRGFWRWWMRHALIGRACNDGDLLGKFTSLAETNPKEQQIYIYKRKLLFAVKMENHHVPKPQSLESICQNTVRVRWIEQGRLKPKQMSISTSWVKYKILTNKWEP